MTQGTCPSCGAAVEFTAGSAQVVVCAHCQTVVARAGASLEAHGRVGAIVDTDSPLRLKAEGRIGRDAYQVVGHLQKDHGAGPWDEWYVEFSDGRTGWLSESEGAFHLVSSQGQELGLPLEEFTPGHRFSVAGHRLVVEERGYGRVVAAEGQLPDDVDPSVDSHYVDATGPGGVFVTLDYGQASEDPEVFVGKKFKLTELGIAPDQLRPRVKKVALQQARCTQCNGPLELRAPDQTRRVACPYCGALLDVRQGKLAFLQLLEKPDPGPRLPLGAKGTLMGAEWICIGFMVRSCMVEGVRYPWEEYLLFNRARGFCWLMNSNGHWVFLSPLDAGEVSVSIGTAAHLEGQRYRAFQSVMAVTETVLGEFYWEVKTNDLTRAVEYVAPPYSVNADYTEDEVTYTRGEYLKPDVIEQAFGLKTPLPTPEGIAPSQPNPHASGPAWAWAGLWSGVLLLLFLVLNVRAANKVVLEETVRFTAESISGTPAAMHLSEPFDVPRAGNMRAELFSPVNNNWLGVEAELVEQTTGEVIGFYEEVSFYSGQDSDGSWNEGERSESEHLSRVPAGRYVLRTQAVFDGPPAQQTYTVRLISDSPRVLWFLCALVLLFIGPVIALLRSSSFETTRWGESNLDASP